MLTLRVGEIHWGVTSLKGKRGEAGRAAIIRCRCGKVPAQHFGKFGFKRSGATKEQLSHGPTASSAKSITSELKLQSQQLEDAGGPHSFQLSRLNLPERESGAHVHPGWQCSTCKHLGDALRDGI